MTRGWSRENFVQEIWCCAGQCLGHQFRKTCPELWRSVSSNWYRWNRNILSRRYGGETTSPTVECTKLEEILSL